MTHPGFRSCDDCEKYWYQESGEVLTRPDTTGNRIPLLRPAGCATPCHRCPKIPAAAPQKTRRYASEFTDRTYRAYRFYQECRAVGAFPNDGIVRWVASITHRTEAAVHRGEWLTLLARFKIH